jgi:hypothetical protein
VLLPVVVAVWPSPKIQSYPVTPDGAAPLSNETVNVVGFGAVTGFGDAARLIPIAPRGDIVITVDPSFDSPLAVLPVAVTVKVPGEL